MAWVSWRWCRAQLPEMRRGMILPRSVTSQDLADFLGRHGIKVERRRIQLDEPIKTLGESTVSVRLHADVTAQLKVSVVRE